MTKKTVLTLFASLLLLTTNTKEIHASSGFWNIIFRAPSFVQEVKQNQDSIVYYFNFFRMLRDGEVLSAQKEVEEIVSKENGEENISEEDNEDNVAEVKAIKDIDENTPSPTAKPIPTAVNPTPKPTNPPTSTLSQTDHILSRINDYRIRHGVAPASKDSHTCSFASLRARELASTFSHDQFIQRKNSGTLPYPSWSNVTENIAMNSDHTDVINQWIGSAGHAANMLADTPYICVGKHGDYYAMLGWKP